MFFGGPFFAQMPLKTITCPLPWRPPPAWRRGFVMHDPHPPDLVAMVGPADVARLPPAEAYAVYRDSTQV